MSISSSGSTGILVFELMKRGKIEEPMRRSFSDVASIVKKDRCSILVGYIAVSRHSSLAWNTWL